LTQNGKLDCGIFLAPNFKDVKWAVLANVSTTPHVTHGDIIVGDPDQLS
jgi:hypothetical protein